ncbi:hypothetical protein HYPSUDRAFT_208221 [Hypholoma sublateritium FD-334 SS-4]|uniref:Uncharacterized protein n=1 Tax=Hypholoma sublateritium (strain FD-334 SS-4) TaxID=945553 RepID=A0A0D2KK55_HYPSF|nr:hypothetical protein HYPSUDRAFT_208221 [Hypholoma sublateritium FD-334 SS-4]
MARPLTSVAFAHPKTATPPPPLLSSIGQAATDSDDVLAGRDDLLYRLDPHRQVPPRLVQAPTRAHLRRASTKVASATVPQVHGASSTTPLELPCRDQRLQLPFLSAYGTAHAHALCVSTPAAAAAATFH